MLEIKGASTRARALICFSFALTMLSGCNQSPTPSSTRQSEKADTPSPVVTATAPLPPATAIPAYLPAQIAGMIRIDDKAYFYSPGKWDTTAIPVCWEPGTPPGNERTWVQDAVKKSWEDNSALRFKFAPVDCAVNAKGIRLAVRDDGPNDGPHTIGLGKAIDGKPAGMVLNFTFKTWSPACTASEAQRQSCIRSIAVHEFGHAIGFAHEQNRPDTPGECTQKPQGQSGDVMLTPWDLHSVMNYCNPVYNNDGMLSPDDIKAVVKVYGA
jgi:hypothetical protein